MKHIKQVWNSQKGMTLMELIIALALLGILVIFVTTGPALYNYESTKAATLQVVQESMEDAMVGYYAITGHFPVLMRDDGTVVDIKTKPYTLQPEDMEKLFADVTRNSGYVMFPREELSKYKIVAHQINDYKLKITVSWA